MYAYYGYDPIYLGALPSEAEFVVHANWLAQEAAHPLGRGKDNRWYLLLAKRLAEGLADLSFSEEVVSRDLVEVRHAFREMTEGRPDGQSLFAFVILYMFDGYTIVDSQWWSDARYVVTMNAAPMTASDRAARDFLGTRATAVSGFFDDVVSAAKSAYGVAKGAVSSVASFVHHPPGWMAAAMPLFTTENQRYWAEKLGGSTGAQLYDSGVKLIAQKALGPQGPQLVDAYNKVVEDASQGHIDAQQILAHAPQIAKLAVASRQGPEAFRAAVAETRSAVKVDSGHSRGR